MQTRSLPVQWAQLLVLTGVHILVDMFAGMLPAILPAVKDKFTLTTSLGFTLLIVLNLSCNGFQMVTGHLRQRKTTPFFMHIGLILSALICLLGLISPGSHSYTLLVTLMAVAGLGIAVSHPEALRAVHTIDLISPGITTAVFMSGGFVGYAAGGWIASVLVKEYSFTGLYPLAVLALVGAASIIALKIKLEKKSDCQKISIRSNHYTLPFWLVMAIAIPVAASTIVINWILPTRLALEDLNFPLDFGGFSHMAFGMGAATGAFLWAWIARRKNDLAITIISLFAGLPFFYIYLANIESQPMVVFLFLGSFCSSASFPLIITMARHARGVNLGFRMGFSVGGSWLIGTIFFLIINLFAEKFVSLHTILLYAPAGYILAAAICFYAIKKTNTIAKTE